MAHLFPADASLKNGDFKASAAEGLCRTERSKAFTIRTQHSTMLNTPLGGIQAEEGFDEALSLEGHVSLIQRAVQIALVKL